MGMIFFLQSALNAQVTVAERPMTQQGLGGMKTAAGRGSYVYNSILNICILRYELVMGLLGNSDA